MWLCADYLPTAAFSLRSSMATSSGGKTNLTPTMYAVKMALVSTALEAGDDGLAVFDLVRPLAIRFRPPEQAVVSNTLVRVLREARAEGEAYARTVGFREFCLYQGNFGIAINLEGLSDQAVTALERMLPRLTYFGKRGSFVQYLGASEIAEPDATFGYVAGDRAPRSASGGVLQYLDDFGERATFAALNTYDGTRATLGRDRILVPVLLPYRLVGSSRGYTRYRRVV